jgi:hypothetical protein
MFKAVHSRHMLGRVLGIGLLSLAAVAASAQKQTQSSMKPRVVITADPELDDNNTLIRAVLYSSDFKIEGLVYASSEFHWKGDGKGTTQYLKTGQYNRYALCPCKSWRFMDDERFIDNIVDAYAEAYPNLKVHNPGYPTPGELKSKVKWGNVAFEGDFSQDTEGSNLIKALLLDKNVEPLYVTVEGGASTVARALKSIYEQYSKTPQWREIQEKVSRKLIIVPSGDQDGTLASYIRPNWPDVKVVQFMGGVSFGYGAQNTTTDENKVYFSPTWTQENVLSRGPLGKLYRVWGDGRILVPGDPTEYFQLSGYTKDQLTKMGYLVWVGPLEKGSFLGEGDTGTFINFVGNGLNAYEYPNWGGWGGTLRNGGSAFGFSRENAPNLPPDTSGVAEGLAPAGSNANAPSDEERKEIQQKLLDAFKARSNRGGMFAGGTARRAGLGSHFLSAAQNDFAARLKWAVTPKFKDANHAPVVKINGPLAISVRPGSVVSLEGKVSDPDGNSVSVKWWQYDDAGTYPGEISFSTTSELKSTFQVPDDAKPGQTIHIVLEATDDGTPPLTHYQRVVVTVR